eukprot:9474017-Pyramimonas_sp.AAC.1
MSHHSHCGGIDSSSSIEYTTAQWHLYIKYRLGRYSMKELVRRMPTVAPILEVPGRDALGTF